MYLTRFGGDVSHRGEVVHPVLAEPRLQVCLFTDSNFLPYVKFIQPQDFMLGFAFLLNSFHKNSLCGLIFGFVCLFVWSPPVNLGSAFAFVGLEK